MSPITVHEWGNGNDVVLILPGPGIPTEHVEPLARSLATQRRVFVPSFRGSRCPLEEKLEGLRKTLADRDVKAASVVGVSFGSYQAAMLAATEGFVVDRLVLLGGFCNLEDHERGFFGELAAMVRGRSLPPGALPTRFLSRSFRASHPEAVASVDAWLGQLDPEDVATELDALSRCSDLRPTLKDLRCPATVRVGANDEASPVSAARRIANSFAFSTYEVVAGVGHLLLVEDFAATSTSVRRALRLSAS
jgi:pimeloyl-ACP methyl ester carboxylesterase